MGLDSYFRAKSADGEFTRPDLTWPDIELCEWLGNGSFRGKLYSGIVHHLTGQSLYTAGPWDGIETARVAAMATALEQAVLAYAGKLTEEDIVCEYADPEQASYWQQEEWERGWPESQGLSPCGHSCKVLYAELQDLARLFRFAADHGLFLTSWW